jgi:hypothetical protein
VTAPVPLHVAEQLKACGWNREDVAAKENLVSRPSERASASASRDPG